MPLTWLDIALLIVMFISGFLAMLRGITRELLSILSWLGAAYAGYIAGFTMQDFARKNIFDHELAGPAILGVLVFFVALVIISLLTMKLSDLVLDSRVGAIDRTFGFLFGLARGMALVVILYVFYSLLFPEKEHPKWVREAQSIDILKDSGNFIVGLLPANIMEILFKKNRGDQGAALHLPFQPGQKNGQPGQKNGQPGQKNGQPEQKNGATRTKEGGRAEQKNGVNWSTASQRHFKMPPQTT